MGNSSSLYLEELKTKQHPILLVTGVKLKSKEVVKFLSKVESECPDIGIQKSIFKYTYFNFLILY